MKPADPDFISITTETAEDDSDADYVPVLEDDDNIDEGKIENEASKQEEPETDTKPVERTTTEPQKKKSPIKRKSNATKGVVN